MGDHMNIFDEIVISKIAVIVRVEPGMAQLVHTNRRFYGLVCNESGRKDYVFDDGTVLHTQAGDAYFLPKHSSYRVVNIEDGACVAVNFEMCQPLGVLPFSLHLPQTDEWFRRMLSCCKVTEALHRLCLSCSTMSHSISVFSIACRIAGISNTP